MSVVSLYFPEMREELLIVLITSQSETDISFILNITLGKYLKILETDGIDRTFTTPMLQGIPTHPTTFKIF